MRFVANWVFCFLEYFRLLLNLVLIHCSGCQVWDEQSFGSESVETVDYGYEGYFQIFFEGSGQLTYYYGLFWSYLWFYSLPKILIENLLGRNWLWLDFWNLVWMKHGISFWELLPFFLIFLDLSKILLKSFYFVKLEMTIELDKRDQLDIDNTHIVLRNQKTDDYSSLTTSDS